MTLNNLEKSNYIKNNFHLSFDLGLNTRITTAETVNLVIPIDSLTIVDTVTNEYTHDIVFPEDYDIDALLNKYEKDIDPEEKEVKCFCTKVIDGDTIDIKIPVQEEGTNTVTYITDRVRLVGINTPETGREGYDISKLILEKICFSKEHLEDNEVPNKRELYLNIDNNKERDNYGRLLAVLIYDDHNINKILLKEGLAELMYIPPSEFNPHDWANINTSFSVYNFTNTDINVLSPYFNGEMTNIVFTPKDDYDTIYSYEIYKNVIYVKLNPFSQYITMHILPKSYDCSNNILFFKDEMIKTRNITNDYKYYKEKDYINSYYQKNGEDRDRTNPDISGQQYNPNSWTNTFCDFSHDISKSTKGLKNIQINAGYRYNKSTPYYSVHFMGIRDKTSTAIEDRCTLIDANLDEIEAQTNNIIQHQYDGNNLYIPKNNIRHKEGYANINHLDDDVLEKTNHKTLKYINDILYAEENHEYGEASWVDLSREG